jgi:nucleoside-diphosphate-sugar epimerase
MTTFANAFVTGSTGLLGNNLVRNLIKRGIRRGRLLPQQDSQRSQVFAFLAGHRDMIVNLVLPGWMVGPGDSGPTSSGQMVIDFVNRRLPGIVPATFSVVDARDVAACHISAGEKGRRGRTLPCRRRNMTMAEMFSLLEKISGVPAPRRRRPDGTIVRAGHLLRGVGAKWKPVLLSLASVRLIAREAERTQF